MGDQKAGTEITGRGTEDSQKEAESRATETDGDTSLREMTQDNRSGTTADSTSAPPDDKIGSVRSPARSGSMTSEPGAATEGKLTPDTNRGGMEGERDHPLSGSKGRA